MKRYLILAAVIVVLIGGAFALAQGFGNPFVGMLHGYEEVPAVSTTGNGSFKAEFNPYGTEINWELTYLTLEGQITQSHIHFAQKSVNGGIVVFLCTNLGNGPVGTQTCPPPPATIRGTIRAADVGAGAAAQGIAAGQFEEFKRALRSGNTYANIHSTIWPGGEVRSQIRLQSQMIETRVDGRPEETEDHKGH